MNPGEATLSGLCARLYRVILEAFRCAISGTSDVQLSSKVQTCGQRFKLWAAGLRMENGELDAQLEEDVEMKDSVLLLLGLILYDLHKMYKNSRSTHVLLTYGDLSLPSDRNLRNSNNLFGPEPENKEDSPDSFSTSGPRGASIIPNLELEDESKLEDHAKWISLLLYICPNLQSFVTDSDLQEFNESVPDSDSQELVVELVEDIVDTVQQLYDLGPSLEWELISPKTQENSGNDQPKGSEHNLEEGVIHYLRLTQDKFSEISTPLALRLAETNWARFQRLEKARATASAERAASATRKIPEKSHADSGYYTGSKSGTIKVQENIGRPKDAANDFDDNGTEYGSLISSMDRFGAYGRLRFPAPPVEQLGSDRGKFDCTVCGSTVGPFRSKQGWRLHVVRDLAPYVCPVLECGSEQLVFDSQRSFTAHLKTHHGISSSWRCRFSECDTSFDELNSFQDHLWLTHGLSEEEDRDQMCKAWTDSTNLVQGESSCSICKEVMNVSLVQQSKHLGRHMIEIALLSIPNHSLEPDESDESDTSELTHSVVSNEPENPCTCETCGIKGKPSNMAICLVCNAGYHAYCLEIPTKTPTLRPDYTWYCTRCGSSSSIPYNLERKYPRVSLNNPAIQESRSLTSSESSPVKDFELHAQDCEYCRDPEEVYRLRGRLCDRGNRLAQDVCSHLFNAENGETYSTTEVNNKLVRVEMPIGYSQSIGLLKAVEKSLRFRDGTHFVSIERTHSISPKRSTNVYVEPSEMGKSTNKAGKATTIDNPGVDPTNTVDPPGLPLSQTKSMEQQLHEAAVERLVKTSHHGRNAIQEALARDEPSAIKDAYLIVRENQIMMENYAGAAASSVAGNSVSSEPTWLPDFDGMLDAAEKYNPYDRVVAFDPIDDDDLQPSVAQSPPSHLLEENAHSKDIPQAKSHARSLEGGAMSTFQDFDEVLSEIEKGDGAGQTPQMIVDDDHQPETHVEFDMNDPQTLQFYTQLILFKEAADRDSMTFPSSLSPTQRRTIHTLAHQLGLWHVSKGDDSQRQLHVYKMHETQDLSPHMPQAKNSEQLAKGAEAKLPTKKKMEIDVPQREKEKVKKEHTEAAELFKPKQVQKIPFGVNPKTVPCAFFKKGNCEKGNKCKFSHDYTDTRDHGEQEDPPTPPSPQAFEQSGPDSLRQANLDEIDVLSQEKPLHKLDIEPPQPSAETKNHLLTQRQEKSYNCPTCQARFHRFPDLKRHTKLHTPERPYTCPKCGRKFARKQTLTHHNKAQGGCTSRPSSFGLKEQMGDVRGDEGMEEREEKEQAQLVPDTFNQFIF